MSVSVARVVSDFGVELRCVDDDDLEMVREWRNHPDVSAHMLSSDTISGEQQRRWFEKIKADPAQQHFVIRYRYEPVGVINGRSTDASALVDASVIEVGMYLAPGSRYRGTVLAFCPALAFNRYCFETLGCERLQAVVLPHNQSAIRFNQQLGYSLAGEDGELLRMQMNHKDYQAAVQELGKVIRF